MFDLPFAPFRRLRTRTRSHVYAAAIGLAGRGLFWPLTVGLLLTIVVIVVIWWTPITMSLYGALEPWWVWILFASFAATGFRLTVGRSVAAAVMLEWYCLQLTFNQLHELMLRAVTDGKWSIHVPAGRPTFDVIPTSQPAALAFWTQSEAVRSGTSSSRAMSFTGGRSANAAVP